MSFVDSKAVFLARAAELGLGDVIDKFEERGWTTFGTFGYSCGYVPGQGEDKILLENVITPLLGAPDHKLSSVVRRLYYESFTTAATELATVRLCPRHQ